MHRYQNHVLAIASVASGLLAAAPARAASLTMVPRSTWGANGVPSYMEMYIYVPDTLATTPPIYISCHSCGSTATGQMGNIPLAKAAADSFGFILLLPDNPGQNCWDVGTTASLTHDGGGDTQAVAQMIEYTLSTYNADASRVYIQGGSGGAMLVQAMLAVYPDLIRAGSARAGVAAGCWADGYTASNQWSNNCASGNTTKTAQEWGDLVRAMYPGYTGHRPRLQTYQGDADTTISYNNTGESIKEWTNVLELSTNPTSTDTGYQAANATYNRQFWSNACGYTVLEAWTSPGGTHSMPYEEADMLKFFGLDVAVGGPDPEPDCPGNGDTGGAGGTGGASAMGGSGGTGASSGTGASGPGDGSGGIAGSNASGGTGGLDDGPSGGSGGAGVGTSASGVGGGTTGTGGGLPNAGRGGTDSGGPSGTGTGGNAVLGSDGNAGPESGSNGCACVVGETKSRPAYPVTVAMALGLFAFRRRQRKAKRVTEAR